MAKLVVPTRNRPTCLSALLDYLARFYPGTEIVIADGSATDFTAAYQAAVEAHSSDLVITHYRYDPGLPLGDRVADALGRINDDIVIVGADDDYPLLDALQRAADFLKDQPDYVLVTGGVVFLKLDENQNLDATLLHARSIENTTAIQRLNYFSRWAYATSYSAVRRKHFIERWKRADLATVAGFGDFTIAFHDCLAGKIKALNELCYIRTSIPTLSKLGRRSNLFYLEHADEILATKDHYRDELVRLTGMTEHEANAMAIKLINARIANVVSPVPQRVAGFGSSPLFDQTVQDQYAAFKALFKEGTCVRGRFIPQLRTIVDAMKFVAQSGVDNAGEPKIYNKLEEMHLSPEA